MFVDRGSIDALGARKAILEEELQETRTSVVAVPVELSRSRLGRNGVSFSEDRSSRHPGAAFGYGRHMPVTGEEAVKSYVQDVARRAQGFLTQHGDDLTDRARRDVSALIMVSDQIVSEISGERSRERARRGRVVGSPLQGKG